MAVRRRGTRKRSRLKRRKGYAKRKSVMGQKIGYRM